jgi:hypothetical protein
MVPNIGVTVTHKINGAVHVQDRNNLTMRALVGIPDEHDIIWDPFWVDWSALSRRQTCPKQKQ